MDRNEKITVRLSPDVMALLQAIVDRGDYESLADCIFEAIKNMIGEKFTPKEISKILSETVREKPIDMESLLTDGDPVSMEEAVKKAVSEYVKNKLEPEE